VHWDVWGDVVSRLRCFLELSPQQTLSCANTKTVFVGPGKFAIVEAFSQIYNVRPPDGDEAGNTFQAHSASSLIFKMKLDADGNGNTHLYVVDLEKMVKGPAAVVPYDLETRNPLWLILAPKRERSDIFSENMEELINMAKKEEKEKARKSKRQSE